MASAHLASALAASGDTAAARTLFVTVQATSTKPEDLMSSGCTSTLLAGLSESCGESDQALRHLDSALQTFTAVADVWSQAHIHGRIGDLHADRDNLHAAQRSWSAAAELLSGNTEPTAAELRQQMIDSLKEDR